jgi:ATP-dependent DNA ligase
MGGESVPQALRPPVALALAKTVEDIPSEDSFGGALVAEPKWDGCRACALVDRDSVSLWSRQSKDLSRYFPELVEALAAQVPPGCVIDGEAVVWFQGRLDFEALQQRLTVSKAGLARLVRELPASFVAFDLLAAAGHDIRALAWSRRRELLEELAGTWVPPLNLSPVTTDRELALQWFRGLPSKGVEGLILKRTGQPYLSTRIWWKVKHHDALDVVVAAVTGPRNRPTTAVAGLPMNGRLWIVGRSTVLSAEASRSLGKHLHPPAGNHPWPEEIPASLLDRFTRDREPVHLTLVEPVVVEVSADVAWSGRAFRHPLRMLRVRPELHPDEISSPFDTP